MEVENNTEITKNINDNITNNVSVIVNDSKDNNNEANTNNNSSDTNYNNNNNNENESISTIKIKFTEASFSVNNKTQVFYTGFVDSKSEEENKNDKSTNSNYEQIIDLNRALEEINNLKIESCNYLQKVMESNENLGATLNKVKEAEFEED